MPRHFLDMPLLYKSFSIGGMLAAVALMLPWLNPVAGGPTPSVMPWLVSTACAACLCFLVATCHVRWEATVRQSWLLAALISAVLGLLQYFELTSALNGWVNTSSQGVAYGNLRQRNQFATLLNVGLIALVCLALRRDARRGGGAIGQSARRDTIWMAAAAVLLAAGNAASLSRTGVLQLVAVLFMAAMWSWWKIPAARRILLLAVLAYLLASVALPWLAGRDPFAAGIANRFADDAPSCQSRLVLWNNVLHLISMRPWIGWGWGNLDLAHFATAYPGARFCDILDNAHNLPLHLAVELGVPVALLVCGLIGWLVLRARPWREADDDRRMAWAVLALIGLHSLLEYPLWYGPFQIAVALALWILWRTRAQPPQPAGAGQSDATTLRPAVSSPVAAWSVGAGAVAVLCVVAYAAWDYHRVSQIYRAPAQRASAYRDDTLAKVRDSWLFRNQVLFADLTLTRVTAENAASINRNAHALLHFSPEARVVEKLIDSALLLGKTEEAVFFMRRMRVAYPEEYAHWRDTREPVGDLPAIDP